MFSYFRDMTLAKRVALIVAGGMVTGLAGFLLVSRLIGGLLYGVRIADPAALAVALGLLTGAAIFANTIPAARAPGIDPASALKQE